MTIHFLAPSPIESVAVLSDSRGVLFDRWRRETEIENTTDALQLLRSRELRSRMRDREARCES